MATERTNGNTNNTQQQQQDTTGTAGYGANGGSFDQPADNTQTANSLFGLSDGLGTTLDFLNSAASLTALCDFINEQIEKNPQAKAVIRAVPIDRSRAGTPLSLFVLTQMCNIGGKTYIPANVLIIGDPNVTLTNRMFSVNSMNMQQRSVEVQSVPSDIMSNPEILKLVKDNVLAAWNHPAGAEVLKAGVMVLPVDFNIEDKQALGQIFIEMSSNLTNIVNMRVCDPKKSLNLSANIRAAGGQVFSRTNFNPEPIKSRTGQPIRADFTTVISAGRANNINQMQQQQTVSTVDCQRELIRTGAFVDFNYFQNNQMQSMMPGQMMMPNTQCLAPRLIATITSASTLRPTVETTLLGIVSLTPLADNYAWAFTFRRRSSPKPMKDFGGVGLLVPSLVANSGGKPAKIKTDGADFGPSQLMQLVRQVATPNPWFSIDLEECGQNSAICELLVNVANKDTEAVKILRFSLNTLTDGKFDEVLATNNVILTDILHNDNNRIHLGHFKDIDGSLVDTREIDLLAVLNHFGLSDPKVLQNWINANCNPQIHEAERLNVKWNIISEITGQTAQLTGYARRYTFMPAFIKLLREAIQRTNIFIQPTNVSFDANGAFGMSYEQIAAMSFSAQGANPFGYQQPTQPGFGGFGGMPGGNMFSF